MTPSFFLDVFRNRLHKDAQPEAPRWYDQRCAHGEPFDGLDCDACMIEAIEAERRKAALFPIVVATVVAGLLIVALIWLPGIP